MIEELNPHLDSTRDFFASSTLPFALHSTFYPVYQKLSKWFNRFSFSIDHSIFSDLQLFYLLATKKYLDHRSSSHLFRLVLSIHEMQKKLLRLVTFSPHLRHLTIRMIPTNLVFPFAYKPVLGCLIGFNLMDRYELFDEENIVLALQKYLPQLRLVKESSYCHTSQHKNLKIFYFEIEKLNDTSFSLLELTLLKNNLEEKVRKSIQPLSPTIFMKRNDEEIYKNILVLSQEIQSPEDPPQAYITLDEQNGKEIVFRITLVHILPFQRFSLQERFADSTFVLERALKVRHLENRPIQAHIFRLHLARDTSLLRSDGSLDFYSARQKVVTLLTNAIGGFRDYNGGILIKQQELLDNFKESFPEGYDPELIETFFYALTPLEKQIILPLETLSALFKYFAENRKEKLSADSIYSFKVYHSDEKIFLIIRSKDSSATTIVLNVLQEPSFASINMAYNKMDMSEEVFFNCVLLRADHRDAESLVQAIQNSLNKWHQKMKDRQILRIALEYSLVSLDPRIGGEEVSSNVLRLLFEGLTRFNQHGQIENAVAETIDISSNLQQYVFKLRPSLWNDGSPVTAYDFEYAWKKILSPDFKTAFAYPFYPIKNAKEAREGKVSPEEIGIRVLDDRTLKVELAHPSPYFLQWTAHPFYSPVHRLMDQQYPQWPYQYEKNYLCNGPFELKINQPNQGYQLVKNPFYWDSNHISLDQILLTLMNPTQAFQAFQKKEIDWVGNPFGGWHSIYTPKKEDHVISFPNSLVCWCVFNTAAPPFNHRKLRQAFTYAIQRTQIIANAFLPLQPAYTLLIPHPLEKPRCLFPEFDQDKARQLLNEAFQELGLCKEDLQPLKLMFYKQGIQEHTALCLKQQIEECLGIQCVLEPLSWSAIFPKMTEGDFQIGLMHWTSWTDDPLYTLNTFKSAKENVNFAKWEHPRFQRLLDLSEQEVNFLQRSAYLLEAEEIISQEIPIIPLYYQPSQALANKDFRLFNRTRRPFDFSRSFYKMEY